MMHSFTTLCFLAYFIGIVIAAGNHHGKGGGMKDKGAKKVFHKHHEKFKPHPKHVQEDAGEQIPDEKITQLVEKNAVQIKARANLDTETDEDKKELETASVDALAYIKYSDAEKDIYLIKVIIGNQFIVHIKIGVKKGSEQDAAGTLMTVLPDKEETDKLNKAEFN